MKLEKHIEISAPGITAVDVLSGSCDLSKQTIKQAMKKGAAWLTRDKHTQRIRRSDRVLKQGDSVHFYYDADILMKSVDEPILVADEGDYSIWVKPYGMLCQGSKWGDHCTINRWVESNHQPQRSAFIVHRLDRAASGLIILAHKKSTATYFSTLFANREIAKCYQAIVHGQFLGSTTCDTEIDGKSAMSHIKALNYNLGSDQSLVEVEIETGRKHQIRRHLSAMDFPIVGDRLYGDSAMVENVDLCLVSCFLSFASPLDGSKKVYSLSKKLSLAS